jgi:hypothetical protein
MGRLIAWYVQFDKDTLSHSEETNILVNQELINQGFIAAS